MEIDKTLASQALDAGLEKFPQFAEFGPSMVWRELMEGGAFMMDYANRPPPGTPDLWGFSKRRG